MLAVGCAPSSTPLRHALLGIVTEGTEQGLMQLLLRDTQDLLRIGQSMSQSLLKVLQHLVQRTCSALRQQSRSIAVAVHPSPQVPTPAALACHSMLLKAARASLKGYIISSNVSDEHLAVREGDAGLLPLYTAELAFWLLQRLCRITEHSLRQY